MGNDPNALRIEPDLVAQAAGAVLGMGDDRVHAAEDAAGGGDLAATRARRQDVVRGHHPRAQRREEACVQGRDREPLVVDDVGGRPRRRKRSMSRDVLGELERPPGGGLETAGSAAPVEALLDP